jgi:hypothetical protein
MNKILMAAFAVLSLLAVALTPAFAAVTQPPTLIGFSTGNASNATIASVIISTHSVNAGAPTIKHINAHSDLATSAVSIWTTAVPPADANYTNTTVSIPVTSTNGFAASDIIVIQHAASDTYERRILTTFTSATNLTVTVAPTTAVAVGDVIWDMGASAAAVIPVGAATLSLTGENLFTGPAARPVLLDVNGTNVSQLNCVSGLYVR